MQRGHRVHKQQLLQRVLDIAELDKVHIAPALQGLEQFVHTRPAAGPDQRQVDGHLPADLLVRGLTVLATGDVRCQFLGVVHPQLDAAELLRVAAPQLLQHGAEEAQLERQTHPDQCVHGIDPFVTFQLLKP